ncbi:hypothetical protein BS78_02G249600 [Paspalum vaginatum]|nr:hypothetical protein BS78_02G249600 [Paspalum vaginatum]
MARQFRGEMAAPTADSEQAAVTAPLSPRGAPGFAVASPKQGATMEAPPSPQGSPGFAVAPTPPLSAPVMAPPQAATMMAPQQQHFAHELVPGSQQGMLMPVQQASMGMILASLSMSLQAQAAQAQAMAVHQPAQFQAMAVHQPAQGMAPSQSLSMYPQPMMEMQQPQAGHLMAHPPLPPGPPPLVQQQQQPPPPSEADTAIMSQPPLPLSPLPATLQQQPPQGALVTMSQAPMPFNFSPVMLQHNHQGNQMTVAQPQLSAPPCKRQRVDQYDNHYGQHMTGHQQETSIFNVAMGQSYGPNLQNGFPSFGAPGTCLPLDATSTIYVDGLPTNCTRREVAHIFRQYTGFRELRLVNKGLNKHAICFVDFATPEQAFLTMRILQGYKFDEQDHNSRVLNLQFSHTPRMGSHGGC